ncbi:hypothetical protein K2173_003108 [Erythroxylum novogranatense]|uniref:Bulb-type lectin domain-containing protein n=1 Tax=Erythroxylum novogranatense TaxID=1862640 RepID=A0AAV8TBB0_9ROSI|nr:hypothetical protein K2173_003108 [Erythroxylum novogranatense]
MSFVLSPFLFSILSSSIAQASVPPSARFQYINAGEFGEYIVEYDANYRFLDPFAQPFQLCFYNTTPNAYTLAVRMGTVSSEGLMRWVWEANRGIPVDESATVTFGEDGNLVLAHSDGRIAWQTNTANKGVVGFELLSNGNMVLYDKNRKFVWQSFDSPTDTLLVGQSLKLEGVTKLVSRASRKQNRNGRYSLVLEPKSLPIVPYIYFSFSSNFGLEKGLLKYVRLNSDLSLSTKLGNLRLSSRSYNTTLSYLRLDINGNLKLYTYLYDNEPRGDMAWENTFTLFDAKPQSLEGTCQLPETCGELGLCSNGTCVACPAPNGLKKWTTKCEQANVEKACKAKQGVRYVKLEGVDHFMSKYSKGNGPMKLETCRNKCTNDCKCLGHFYNTQTHKCWIAYDLKTLTKVPYSTHLAFLKMPIN